MKLTISFIWQVVSITFFWTLFPAAYSIADDGGGSDAKRTMPDLYPYVASDINGRRMRASAISRLLATVPCLRRIHVQVWAFG